MDVITENAGEYLMGYAPRHQTIVSLRGGSMSKSTKKGSETLAPSDALEYNPNAETKMAWWGDDNNFPSKIDKEIELNPTLAGAIKKKIEYLYAGGIEYGMEEIQDKKRVWIPLITDEINAIIDSLHCKQYLAQSIYDYIRYGSVFPEFVFTTDKSKVAFCTEQEAINCRWEKQNPKTGFIDFVYINRNWLIGRKEDSEDTIKVPVIDPLVDLPDLIRSENKIFRYIFRSRVPTSKPFYPLVDWWSVKTSGWLDVSNYIPRFKKSLMERQMSVRYHIEVDVKWLQSKYGQKWEKASPEEKQEIFKAEIKHFNEMMQGPDNAGGNIMTTKFFSPDLSERGEWVSNIVIHDLNASSKSGEYIEDSNEADAKIHYAVGLDMTMSNTKGGSGGGGAGSGSDKREAFNMEQSTNSLHVSVILAPIYWMLNYNGLNPKNKIKLRMRSPYLQTLNQVSEAKRATVMPE